jgi:hypothetical protein
VTFIGATDLQYRVSYTSASKPWIYTGSMSWAYTDFPELHLMWEESEQYSITVGF